ncbi:hypothetical protein OZL92_20825 [Bacillus sonorensis]|uniref:Uncharacterized protein n=1 Tax=Bacillus sonorensis TaxID=119858 RepID=A0ABN5AJS3_9BACI|nr:hypothetical protein [Bacillus sonorensis]ASB90467.1 hypothetical protein S101395_03964 [Bacillus sonorensis]MCZ0074665.1 hypothetical protein [Bacillus sonorensis]MCZ0093773.1 hypothetical protein [Bacillus sonorensis]MDI3409545.1 hypothetical protein [Bacillus sonorensis]MDR4959626.1 hypothetical protein [Bacillus sonorensis]
MTYVAIACLLFFAWITVTVEAKTTRSKLAKIAVLIMYAIPIGVLVASLC